MIVSDPQQFLTEFHGGRYPPDRLATARGVFLVSPDGFALAAESARDNRYMDGRIATDRQRARDQHAQLACQLGAVLPTVTFPGLPDCPDAVFPNNVFATAKCRLIIGRMRHPVRQREAQRADIRRFFSDLLGYHIIDLSNTPDTAELTGAIAIDRARGIGYCGLSERCTAAGARAMHAAFGLKLTFCFELAASEYHTNVVLAILAGKVALIAADGFRDKTAAAAIASAYGRNSVLLDSAQKLDFAGNAIALGSGSAWFSTRAAAALQPDQRATLARSGLSIHSVDLDEIEKAGGSLRCCVAEIF